MKHKKITFLYQQDNDNKIHMIQHLAHVWQNNPEEGPFYDEEYEWAKCIVNRSRHFDLGMFNRPSLVGAITVLNTADDIVWLQDAGAHQKTYAVERDEVITQSYVGIS